VNYVFFNSWVYTPEDWIASTADFMNEYLILDDLFLFFRKK